MKTIANKKYRTYRPIELPDRQWPNRIIEEAPRWCSVDLRDGNQALITPMNLDEKVEYFLMLTEIGFKEIEVGFPSASEVEYSFLRKLIDDRLIPEDVTIQVLTQAREHLIRKTFDALRGSKQAVLHLYNSTSELQRRVVFHKEQEEILNLAVDGVKLVRSLTDETDTHITLEYSPESFTGTETDFALRVCEAVMDAWGATEEAPAILNLPATVEMSTPNIYADQIEWFIRNLSDRKRALISLHTHNDRGTGVAATELALMAGADRVEGTLFGNGERTGNVDIVTLALNLFTQGVDPGLDFSRLNHIIDVYEKCTRLPVHMRHPYAGELVYTAFSGSHQDAINKGMGYRKDHQSDLWEVPYLPMDPTDVGRTYESIIRINSQSGKGGVAYVMEKEYGFQLPRALHPELGELIQRIADSSGKEILPEQIYKAFLKEFVERNEPFEFGSFNSHPAPETAPEEVAVDIQFRYKGEPHALKGEGNGPIDAAKNALSAAGFFEYTLEAYSEHSLGQGSASNAIAYIQLKSPDGQRFYGAGMDTSITRASIRGLFAAMNRSIAVRSNGH